MPETAPFRPSWTSRRIAIGLGVAAAMAVLLTIDGPGITVDEPLDVRPGRNYVATLRAKGVRFFDRAVGDAVYRDNAEHPPLGRWLLGLASTAFEPIEIILRGGPDPTGTYVASGRVAPALVFGLLVGLVAAEAGRRWGRGAGLVAGVGLAIMPRAFAHAHLGALDTFIAAAWAAALIAAARAVESRRPSVLMALAGVAWGLALLTKIQAWFLPPIVLAWAVARLGPKRAFGPMVAWTGVGLATFVAGWPWLWHDTLARWSAYLGTGVERISIRALYFGTAYADRDLPWHYPWVYFLATVPVGLQLLGGWGLIRGWRGRRADPFPLLLAGSILVFLAVFSTNAPVYDGERLFLAAFPLWAILIGLGFADLWGRAGRKARVGLAGLVLAQGYGVVALHPFGLSYYNALVGGLPGAERLGLELTYWGDAVDRTLLDRLAAEARAGEAAAMAPTLAPQQGAFSTTRALARIPTVMADQDGAATAEWLVVSRREAYWPPAVRDRLGRDLVVERRARQGVWLSCLLRARKNASP
ncbi:ArnT family glycosyltransferase [Tundrisphaera sp. TA3]|uniref:ArnT family glycosyltransferase n=1 Tax=Tundrisphaera sp. TA3 TaxID=3435775 RepID=UPI003EB6B29F